MQHVRTGVAVLAATTAATLLLPLAPASAVPGDVVADGNFATPPAVPPFSTFCVAAGGSCPAPSPTFGAWTVTSGSINLYDAGLYAPPAGDPAGTQSVDTDGDTPGVISQTLGFVPANTVYNATFQMNGNIPSIPLCGGVKSLTMSINGKDYGPFIYDPSANSGWILESFSFFSTGSGNPVLTITSNTPGYCGAVITDVSIVPAPVGGATLASPAVVGPVAGGLGLVGVAWYLRRRRHISATP